MRLLNYYFRFFNIHADNTSAAAGELILAEHDRSTIWFAGGKLIRWRGLAVHNNKEDK